MKSIPQNHVCPNCGKTFARKSSRPIKYCSQPCHDAARRNKVEHTCPTCGTSYLRSPAKRSGYCSLECYYKACKQSIGQRFWSKVSMTPSIDDCWVWTASRMPTGYGQFNIGRKCKPASRVAYELTYGTFERSLCVLHRCDNPPCCNPSHLFLGTQVENIQDMRDKGRGRVGQGERAGKAKLTAPQVIEIRTRCKQGEKHRIIACDYGVTANAVSDIHRHVTWAHLP